MILWSVSRYGLTVLRLTALVDPRISLLVALYDFRVSSFIERLSLLHPSK